MKRALSVCLLMIASPALADPSIFISDVLNRPLYRAAYDRMVRGVRGLPRWAATSQAATETTMMPGATARIGNEEKELYRFCEPHNCGGHTVVVMFDSVTPQDAKAIVSIDQHVRFLGDPTADEAKALIEAAAD